MRKIFGSVCAISVLPAAMGGTRKSEAIGL